jgi:hypothetical protein
MAIDLTVNGVRHSLEVAPETPLKRFSAIASQDIFSAPRTDIPARLSSRTAVIVKLLLPPRQSRGNSYKGLA